jgi:hypothetical protein
VISSSAPCLCLCVTVVQKELAGEVLPASELLTDRGLAAAPGLRAGSIGFFIESQTTS